MNILRFLIRAVLLILAVFTILPLVLIGIMLAKILHMKTLNIFLVTYWSGLVCWVCGIKIDIYGHIHPDPVFIVANHVSWLDIPIIHSMTLAGFVAKSEIRKWPILGWISLLGDTVFIKRGSHHSRKNVLDTIKKRLSARRSVIVFPEGTVTDGSHLRHFHQQLLVAAVETETPIQPLAIKFKTSNGNRNVDMAFINNESFLAHVWRILTLPKSYVEVHCGQPIGNFEHGARVIAKLSREYIEKELMRDGYLKTSY